MRASRFVRLCDEKTVLSFVAGSIQPNDNAVSDQLIVPYSFDGYETLEALSIRLKAKRGSIRKIVPNDV